MGSRNIGGRRKTEVRKLIFNLVSYKMTNTDKKKMNCITGIPSRYDFVTVLKERKIPI